MCDGFVVGSRSERFDVLPGWDLGVRLENLWKVLIPIRCALLSLEGAWFQETYMLIVPLVVNL